MQRLVNFLKYYVSLIILAVVVSLRLVDYCGGVQTLHTCSAKSSQIGSQNIGFVKDLRAVVTNKVYSFLPSPHADLLLGMVLGIDNLKKSPRFNDILKTTGTIHVVVVSGYNISMVFDLIFKLLGSKYQLKNLLTAQIAVFMYSVLSGFQVPVIRSLIMGSIVAWGRFYGRSLDVVRVLLFSGLLILAIWPDQLFSLSFQLSFMATLSLVCFSKDNVGGFVGDLKSTLSAQILVFPLISFYFGRISLVSPLSNMFILWVVPLCTVFGVISIPLFFLPLISNVLAAIIFIPLDFFVTVVGLFSSFPYASINFFIGGAILIFYYLFVLAILLFRKRCP